MNKNATEMAMNLIIIAAIGLLVLAIIMFIFSGKINTFNKGTSYCSSLGGECQATKCSADTTASKVSLIGGTCPESGQDESLKYCCKTMS